MRNAWLGELRVATRQLARTPAFCVAVIMTLALGIGASTLIFSVINGVLLAPLPYPEPERIVRVFERNREGGRMNVADPNFAALAAGNRSFAAMAQVNSVLQTVVGGSEPIRVGVAWISDEFHAVFGVEPTLGRTFLAEERVAGAAPAALISFDYWQRYLGGAPESVSRTLMVGDQLHTVVGIMPRGFEFPPDTDVWIPRERLPVLTSRTAHNLEAYGRLAPGVTASEAYSDLAVIARRLKAQFGADTMMEDVVVAPLDTVLVGSARPTLFVLTAAVALLLFVACANVLSMLLARAVVREQEFAVRAALGASRLRVARQFFAEAAVLCAAACVIGILLAQWALSIFLVWANDALPRAESIRLDSLAVAFAGVLSLLVAGGLTVFVARRAFDENVLRTANRRDTRSRLGLRDGLVATQIALALVLVVGAGLLGRSLLALADVDPGFRADGALLMNVALPFPRNAAAETALGGFHAQLLDRLRELPGVEAVGGVTALPLAGNNTNGGFVEINYPDEIKTLDDFGVLVRDPARRGQAEFRVASEEYFAALGIPLLQGRLFDRRDGPDGSHVALISRSLAEGRWPQQDPVGKLVQFGNMDGDLTPFTVIGVVGDVRDYGLDADVRPTFYAYYRQRPRTTTSFWIAIRARNATALMVEARQIVQRMNPDLPPEFRTSESLVSASIAERSVNLLMLAVFGAAALFLAVGGVYGAFAFNVAQRTQEIGVRMALGARGSSVIALVMRKSLVLGSTGVLAGLALAFGASQMLGSLLYGVPAHDPVAYVAASVVLLLATVVGSWLPARRAARIAPTTALRHP
jgi:predicted permease